MADRLAKEATQNNRVTYSRIPKSAIKKGYPEKRIRKWQSRWEETTKERLIKIFFSKCRKKTGSESKLKFKCNNNHDRPWKYSILLTSIKNYRKSRVPMQSRHRNGTQSDISAQKAKELKRNSEGQCT